MHIAKSIPSFNGGQRFSSGCAPHHHGAMIEFSCETSTHDSREAAGRLLSRQIQAAANTCCKQNRYKLFHRVLAILSYHRSVVGKLPGCTGLSIAAIARQWEHREGEACIFTRFPDLWQRDSSRLIRKATRTICNCKVL